MKPERNLYGVEDVVVELQARGYDMNDMELLSWLRRHGYLVGEKGDCYNAPSSACLELGWMAYQRTIAQGSGGRIHIELRPMFTEKGSNRWRAVSQMIEQNRRVTCHVSRTTPTRNCLHLSLNFPCFPF